LKALIEIAAKRTLRAFLVGVQLKSRAEFDVQESMAELAELADTLGAKVMGQAVQKLEAPAPGTYIGKGKAAELAEECRKLKVDTVILDDELSPAQARNLEAIFECKIIDRTTLILDIFARRARSRDGKLQVELAQLEYLLPRLTRFWGHLSRQAGGIGIRGGEGESQLEADRRKVRSGLTKSARKWRRCAASGAPSGPGGSAANGRWPRSSATPTPANPPCSTR